jgi:Phosphotransferase enzyme family
VRSIELPAFSYTGSSQRPGWSQLPPAVRAAMSERLGDILDVTVVGGGFTAGFAALVRSGSDRVFVKAAPAGSDVGVWYAREAQIVRALPRPVPTPRLRWVDELAGHVVLCFDAVDGRMPELGWSAPDLTAALAAHDTAALALADPPPALAGLVTATLVETDPFDGWRRTLAGECELPVFAAHLAPRLTELAAWEARIGELCAGTTAMMHCDVRLDNVLIDADGAAWICDWNHVCRGPAWLDAVALLLSAVPGGHDVDALFHAQACVEGAPADALDVGLAVLSGFYVLGAARPEVETSPNLRRHQRFYLDLAAAWLSRRHGW